MGNYEKWTLSLGEVKGKIDRGELTPDTEWQRGYIWKESDEKMLIDSIVRGMPIPKFYLTYEYDAANQVARHYAIDGQQRLTAIHRFLSNQFPVKLDDGNEKYFRELGTRMQEHITTYELNGHILKDYDQNEVNFLFQRLNRTGLKLTNMELWNNEYTRTNVLKLVKETTEEHEGYYVDMLYTEDNIRRMVPLDDTVDILNCLNSGKVESGRKNYLETFLTLNRDISKRDSESLKSKFRKVVRNLKEILPPDLLRQTLFAKRTHFISLFLAIAELINQYFILCDVDGLGNSLIAFINEPPKAYAESVLGAIRNKDMRQRRVRLLKQVIKDGFAIRLDPKRRFSATLLRRLWNTSAGNVCGICRRPICDLSDAVVDHIVPWAKGGPTEERNAQLAHKRCNARKRDEWEGHVSVQ